MVQIVRIFLLLDAVLGLCLPNLKLLLKTPMGRYKPKNVKGNYKGTNQDEFITGSGKAQTIDGQGGNDALAIDGLSFA